MDDRITICFHRWSNIILSFSVNDRELALGVGGQQKGGQCRRCAKDRVGQKEQGQIRNGKTFKDKSEMVKLSRTNENSKK